MTTTMAPSVISTVLMYSFLVGLGVQSLEPEDGASLHSGALDLPWQDELCCDSPSAHHSVEGGGVDGTATNRSQSNLPQQRCSFRGSMTESQLSKPSGGPCVDVLCRIDGNWENLTCDLQSRRNPSGAQEAGVTAVSLQRLLSVKDNKNPTSDNPVVCEAEDSFMCSVTLDPTKSYITMVTISISDALASPVLLRIPARPVKPSPPVNVSHTQTIEAELLLRWDDPSDFDSGPLRYEVRYSSNTTHPAWQVVSELEVPRLSLDLEPKLNYTIQVRCSGLDEPPLWSEWSELHHIRLDTVSYIPESVVARPGENVTVYCVFNDHRLNANTAAWKLNLHHMLDRSQYRPVNQRVSQITVRPSETQMYDLLQCTQEWTIPYSKIYVEGAVIDIDCVTSGDIDSMTCSWTNMKWMTLKFQSKWADLQCDEMEERERAGENVGEMGPVCMQKPCTIKPLRMNCYKLWLEVQSPFGPIRSKPVYLTPIDYVKPHTPTDVKAVSRSSGVLAVTWKPPCLPAQGVQCQFRYHSLSTVRAKPDWKVQRPVNVTWAEAVVPDMCQGYVVQVRCMHTSGTNYWSEWSDSVYSTPQNSRAPERGPDFWRIRHDDPYKNTSDVTLLFKHLPVSGNSYCVDGFIVQRQASSGSVIREKVELGAPYRFEWNQELQTVTVEAYNILGSSTNNMNMTLEKQPKRPCVRSFHVLVINSTCVSLSWTLLDNSSVPLFMVVQWSLQRQQDSEDSGLSGETWTRLPYTDQSVYLKGDFFGSEEYGFYLYPVFAEGEGEPVYTLATRGDPAAYMMLMVISFVSIVLFVTLVISQNQIKRFVWKDVPNPYKCSWGKELDFKKVDTFEHLFRPAEGLPAWPLLLSSENISSVIIMDKSLIQSPLVSLTPDPASAFTFDLKVDQFMQSDSLQGPDPSSAITLDDLTSSSSGINELQPAELLPTDSSAQSSVTYSTVLVSDPKQDQQTIHLHCKDGGSGNSSSDEGNFSANNSDVSESFACGLWELESCRLGDDPRRSCSYNSVEEISETSEQEDEGEMRHEADLYYLRMGYPAEDEASEEEEEHQREAETNTELFKNVVLNRDDCSVESHPLLGPEDSDEPTFSFSPLYMPQFRTAPCLSQVTTHNTSCD